MSKTTDYSSLISDIYQSRRIILEILHKKRGFDISDYAGCSINELNTMQTNKQLDMIFEHPETKQRLYIKYHLAKNIKENHLYELIDDLYDLEQVLDDNDDLILISKHKVSQSLKSILEQIYIKDHKFINIYNINDYLFNILEHKLVPNHIVLSEKEKDEIVKKYYITDLSQFPEISRFDPVAQAIGLRPGQLCRIIRPSPTAIETNYYRLCY